MQNHKHKASERRKRIKELYKLGRRKKMHEKKEWNRKNNKQTDDDWNVYEVKLEMIPCAKNDTFHDKHYFLIKNTHIVSMNYLHVILVWKSIIQLNFIRHYWSHM